VADDVVVEINADGWVNMVAYLNSVVLRSGIRVENKAKQRCPVDTGYLRSSIQTRAEQQKHDGGTSTVEVTIGSVASYAVHVELGTSRMAARPYLRSSITEVIAEGLK
jgi:HK97 gp10 family phage protein